MTGSQTYEMYDDNDDEDDEDVEADESHHEAPKKVCYIFFLLFILLTARLSSRKNRARVSTTMMNSWTRTKVSRMCRKRCVPFHRVCLDHSRLIYTLNVVLPTAYP